jgi:hypothetical protein
VTNIASLTAMSSRKIAANTLGTDAYLPLLGAIMLMTSLTSSIFAITFNHIIINSSVSFSVGMSMDENNAITSKDLLFEDTENKMFLFLEKLGIIRSCR